MWLRGLAKSWWIVPQRHCVMNSLALTGGSGGHLQNLHSFTRKYTEDKVSVNNEKNDTIQGRTGERGSLAKSLACLPDELPSPAKRLKTRQDDSEEATHSRTNMLSEDEFRAISLAKSLACLPDESSTSGDETQMTRVQLRRLIEHRIKKRVKEQYMDGKFYNLMNNVIADADTLLNAYNIVRINSNIDLEAESGYICFDAMADQLRNRSFDVKANTHSFSIRSKEKESLVLPNLDLKVVQEAVRVVLEVVFRPSFSKISHGCRSERGHRSALRYVCRELGKSDWCFTLHMRKKADLTILVNIISLLKEKIEDSRLVSFIQTIFDANVLNLQFGGFPKGQGLPQEGVLSPILMNIYLGKLDVELFRLSMKYEALLSRHISRGKDGMQSNLRLWFRRQMKQNEDQQSSDSGLQVYACRFMDEIFVGVLGPREIAMNLKDDIKNYIEQSLCIKTADHHDIIAVQNSSLVGNFLGMVIHASASESSAVRAVHKLKDKVRLFAEQKETIWNTGMVRIGKKWLGHGLKRLKESEIKQLGLSNPVLDHISQFRKDGMKTDHWFRCLLKVWLQDVNAVHESSEEDVLSKYIAEPAIPKELRESYYHFQKCAKYYVSCEAATLAKLSNPNINVESQPIIPKVEAPVHIIKDKLLLYGVINNDGFPRHVSALILQDDGLIVSWFSGLINRWFKWYSEHENLKDIKELVTGCIRKSCIRTLAAKHRIDERLIEKQFELELSSIPLVEDLETNVMTLSSNAFCDDDEYIMYGISYSGLCILSLSKIESPSSVSRCCVMGCCNPSPNLYTLHVKDQQKYPGWKTGFGTSIHISLNLERIALCSQHVKDLYIGNISLQSIEFGTFECQ